MRFVIVLLLGLCMSACATYREDLNRGQRHYEENEYERALAIFRYLEHDFDSLSLNDQARYAYLRGMTDYRLSADERVAADYRPHARHWLAVAKAIEQEHPGGLSDAWKQLLEDALKDLNRDYFFQKSGSVAATETQPPPADTDAGASPPPADAGTEAAPSAPGCQSAADCADDQTCLDDVCVDM
jgi:hypothetical protein